MLKRNALLPPRPPSCRVALCSRPDSRRPSGLSARPSNPWLFCRPVTGSAGTGARWPVAGLLDEKFSLPWRIGISASGGRMALSSVPSAR